jgi:glyoxylase-like metal-dependent hydrolase (beta-lactamase superfamily II)
MTLTTGSMKQCEYPAICALINHPRHGYILFDTGYSDLFFQLTQKFPYSMYQRLTPVTLKKTLKQQLLDSHIKPTEINYIVISHFHADHIGGLSDYPNAQFICHQEAINSIQNKQGFRALLMGFLPELLPNDFYKRTIIVGSEPIALEAKLHPFTHGFDLFGDRTLIIIPLPGHTKGHIGLYVKAHRDAFFIADSCWHQETFKQLIYPSLLTYLAVHDNKKQYIQTIQQLHALYQSNKDVEIIPSHCQHSRAMIGVNT